MTACGEVWTDEPTAALSATVDDPKSVVRWEAVEGPPGVVFADAAVACTRATFPDDRVYAVPIPTIGGVKQLKVAFADGEPATGTVRLDYIWAGRLP